MIRPSLVLARASLLACLACSSPPPDNPEGPGGPTGAECPLGSTLTYASFAQNFFKTYCTRCHSSTLSGAARNGAPPERNFDTYSGISTTDAALIDSVAAAGPAGINTFMPRNDPRPSNAARYQLGEWLACHEPP